jgi:hypothetical protein
MNPFLTIVWWSSVVLFLSFICALGLGAFIKAGKGP